MFKAAGCCFGGAAFLYLWSSDCKSQAQILNGAVRVKELQELGELIGNSNISSLLVAVSGKVGSNEAFMCKRSGVLAVSLTEKAKLVFKTESSKEAGLLKTEFKEAGLSKTESEEILLSQKTVPWFLEDDTGRVNVVGFHGTFKRNVFDEPLNELYERVLRRKEVKIVKHTCSEDLLEIGTPLSIIAEAYRGKDGAPTIHALPSQVFNGYTCVDKEVSNLESQSAAYESLSFILATTGVLFLTVPLLFLRFG